MNVRVVVVDDQAMIRAGLTALLTDEPGIDVVAEASDGAQALRAARTFRPDVVLMDVRMPGMDGLEATRRLVEAGSSARVLMLTTFDLDEYVFRRAARRSEWLPAQGRAGRSAHRGGSSRRRR